MRMPPLLLGAALLFWGWQSDLLAVGAVMAVILESARFIKWRWEFSEDDFGRVWTLCALLFLGTVIFAFTQNAGPAHIANLFENPSAQVLNQASAATSRTFHAPFRWMPLIFFLFVAVQYFSVRGQIPLTTIDLILRMRWKKWGQPAFARGVDISYPYFALCLFAASIHTSENHRFFFGLCALAAWALWSARARRFSLLVWAAVLALVLTLVLALGFWGREGVGEFESYLQRMDPKVVAWFMRRHATDPFQSETSFGRIGELKLSGEIVVRLDTPPHRTPPAYLREASYRLFRFRRWVVGSTQNEFTPVLPESGGLAWILVPAKTNSETVHLSCFLEGVSPDTGQRLGLLPLPTGCGRLDDLPALLLKKSPAGAVLADGPGLLRFDARYGPGATLDAPFNPAELAIVPTNSAFRGPDASRPVVDRSLVTNTNRNPDLLVPDAEQPALNQVIAELGLANAAPPRILHAVGAFFQDRFQYSTWQDRPHSYNTNLTFIARFLLKTRRGHCEYFATATVLLLRQLGVPARYAVGYSVHEASGSGYVVRLCDAHAWCLVWDEQTRTWQDFDTTPASWVAEEQNWKTPLRPLSDLWSWLKLQFSKFRWSQANYRPYLLLALVPLLAVLFFQIFFHRQRRAAEKKTEAEFLPVWPGLDSEFYLIEKKLAERGVPRQLDEPLSGWLERAAADPALADAQDALRDLLRLHYRYRFDPRGLSETEREELRREAQACLVKISAAVF